MLGSILLSPAKSIEICEGMIKPEYIFCPGHRVLYETIVGLHHSGTPTDIITLTAELQKLRRLAEVGGAAYLAELQMVLPTATNLPYYLEIIVENWHKRELVRVAQELAESVSLGKEEMIEASKEMVNTINGWREKIITGPEDPTDQKVWFDLIEDLETRFEKAQKGLLEGIPTGIKWLDLATCGLQPETFYYIGGLPGAGKSAIISQMAVAGSRTPRNRDGRGHKSLIFSVEMSGKKFRERMLAQDEAIGSGALKSGLFSNLDFERLTHTVGHLRDHIFIYAKRLNVSEIRSAIKRALAKHPDLDWIGIDYLQYVSPEVTRRNSNREQEVAQISGDLNDLKKEFGLPIVCAAALNSDQDKRKGGKPIMTDFRDSKKAAYDADFVLMLHASPSGLGMYRDVEGLIVKNRDGPLDERMLSFSKKHLLFSEKTE